MAVRIEHLIHLSMTAVVLGGCGDIITTTTGDEFDSYDGCGEETREDFDVSEWNLTTEHMAVIYDNQDVNWAELDDTARCQVVCAYANGELGPYTNNYYGHDIEFGSCELDLTMDADVVTGGVLSCAGEIVITEVCLGRRPLGWSEGVLGGVDQLTEMTILEHASVTAFAELAGQLEQLGAPAELLARCRAAAEDERAHVDLLVGLGAPRPSAPVESSGDPASLVAIAVHNATEGCVSETWAALLAAYQAEHAQGEAARRAFAQITEDETRHAQLAWDLHAWLRAGLSEAEREQVEAARAEALRGLGAKAMGHAMRVPAAERRALGLPDPRTARALAEDFGRRLAVAC